MLNSQLAPDKGHVVDTKFLARDEFQAMADSKGATEKVIYVVKPILVPVEALEYKSATKTENQWKIYN